jgi:hypothetical protein
MNYPVDPLQILKQGKININYIIFNQNIQKGTSTGASNTYLNNKTLKLR